MKYNYKVWITTEDGEITYSFWLETPNVATAKDYALSQFPGELEYISLTRRVTYR